MRSLRPLSAFARSAPPWLALTVLLSLAGCRASGLEVDVDGTARRYLIEVGPEVGTDPAPLVFVWHGFGGTAREMLTALDPAEVWPEAIVVAPVGLPRTFDASGGTSRPGWQVKRGELGDRDLAFFDALLSKLIAERPVDLDRIYSTGFSNGGAFTNLLGCVRADDLAAIAPVGGFGPAEPACGVPMPVVVVHGSGDGVIPYDRGRESWDRWQDTNSCGAGKGTVRTTCFAARGCDVDTRLCSFTGGHVWPAGGSRLIVEFFAERRRR